MDLLSKKLFILLSSIVIVGVIVVVDFAHPSFESISRSQFSTVLRVPRT
jgi:hypothetical protein